MAKTLKILKETFWEFYEDDSFTLAAALSYYIIFALPSLFIIIIAIVSVFVDPTAIRGQIVQYTQEYLHPEVADQFQLIFQEARDRSFEWNVATVFGVGALIFAATIAFARLQTALNQIWQVQPKPGQNMIVGFLLKRAFSFVLVIAVALVLMFSLTFSVVLTTFTSFFLDLVPRGITREVALTLDALFSFAMLSLVFAAIFKILPDVRVSWRDVWVGAVATAVLFVIGKYLIGLYLSRSDIATAYGAAGSLAIVLVWFYYSSLLLFLGAEFTQVYARHSGRRIKPERGAEAVPSDTGTSKRPPVVQQYEAPQSVEEGDSTRL